jgi:RHS repeat-associated protein
MISVVETFTGKERDAETGLDYFGARYYSGAQGRFTSPDPKEYTQRTIEHPQKWNKYAYVRNNPLVMIDPDGQDDFYVFRPTASSTSASWRALQAAAPKYGHTVTIYNGTAATRDRYLTAVGTEGAHVIATGHTVEDNTQRATAVLLGDNLGALSPDLPGSVPVFLHSFQSFGGLFGCGEPID